MEKLMPADDQEETNGFHKPAFDGRVQYYKLLMGYMGHIGETTVEGDLTEWYRTLRSMFSIVQPFIKQDEAKQILARLKEISKLLSLSQSNQVGTHKTQASSSYDAAADNLLHETTDSIYLSAKHMLLPTKEEDSDELNLDTFNKESDA